MNEKILVVGAGMAGIIAARTLQDAGCDVTVFEARDRIGGRTHTDHSLGLSVDLGAAWIHGKDGNPLAPIAAELGVETGYTDFQNRSIGAVQAYDHVGEPLDRREYAEGLWLGGATWTLAYGSLLHDRPTGQTLAELWEDGLPRPDHLSRAAELGFKYQALISTEYVNATDADQLDLSLTKYLHLPGGDYLMHGGGFNVLTDHFAEGLTIETGVEVIDIDLNGDPVLVRTTTGSLAFDRVILTVPLGVLKGGGIQFRPPLPEDKLGAIDRIGFGNYEKLALRFDRFYWPKSVQRFNLLTEPTDAAPSLFHAWLNIGAYTDQPVIVSYHAGRRAQAVNRWDTPTLVAQTLEAMRTMFGRDVPEPEAVVRTAWETDPYSRGSYSFAKIGQQPRDRLVLAEPIDGRLFFAGEATHPHFFATVHGAYETGIRAAREVMATL